MFARSMTHIFLKQLLSLLKFIGIQFPIEAFLEDILLLFFIIITIIVVMAIIVVIAIHFFYFVPVVFVK